MPADDYDQDDDGFLIGPPNLGGSERTQFMMGNPGYRVSGLTGPNVLFSQGQVACKEPLSECYIILYCEWNGLALEPQAFTL